MEGAPGTQSSSTHRSKYLCSINGPILYTAPHSGKLNRGGALYGEKKRIHLREKYVSVLAMRFAFDSMLYLKSKNFPNGQLGSFCIWSTEHKLNEVDVDPNYLQQSLLHDILSIMRIADQAVSNTIQRRGMIAY